MNKQSRLALDEWDYLSRHFGLCESDPTRSVYSVKALDLLDVEICSDYLDRLTVLLQSPSRMITASQFFKRYAALTAVPLLYAMTVYNKGLDLSAENCSLESSPGHSWLEYVSLADTDAVIPEASERHIWRNKVILALFAENIGKLIAVMSKVANIPKSILWENVAVRLFSLYEKRIGLTGEQQEQSRADFQYLVHQAPGALFGEKQNPLSRFYGKPTFSSASNMPMRVRKTCCFYYEVSSVEEYCSSCPKLNS
ncbi:IucA/IucC family C-terminal-domain containing protein [Paenibacillus alba]|uniref:IucA/IucC family C-terminal-domain containing protein n=1 Tax=Paenibacillus alba TaxID=1197127 RepID=A0ABU6FYU6_9BACL|nr:IucA/IucC family C-terminal-domain containing protein [Paenibacillus alba]MEC0225714.1 IucA/IucC family C-terminal-domain containing protein [Paenibacillus alba]